MQSPDEDEAATAGKPWLAVLAATLLSMAMTGYIPLYNNNIYHLTILNADFDRPQFANDAIVQSLRHFSSGFWMLFTGIGNHMPATLFLGIAFVLSRLAMFAACLHLAGSLGYRGRKFNWVFLGLLAVSPLMIGYAPGGGGLNIEYFSHSELANAALVFSLSLAFRNRFGLSAFLVCVTFFLNAFMAVWLSPLWAAVVLVKYARGEVALLPLLRRTALGILFGLPLVALVVKSVIDGQTGYVPDYSYAAYLRGFFPDHFFLDSLNWIELGKLALLALTLPVLAPFLKSQRGAFLALSIGAIALLAIGSLLPLLTDARLLLNLHMIRSAVLLQLFVALGLALVAADAMTDAAGPRAVYGYGLVALMLLANAALVLVPLALAGFHAHGLRGKISPILEKPETLRLARIFAFACLLVQPVAMVASHAKGLPIKWALADTWMRAGEWADKNTPATSTFLLPVAQEDLPAGANPLSQYLDFETTGFSATSHRVIWTSYKYGAAPMWAPETYHLWSERYQATLALMNTKERFAYARANHITHVATFCDPALVEKPAYRDDDFCIYAMNP